MVKKHTSSQGQKQTLGKRKKKNEETARKTEEKMREGEKTGVDGEESTRPRL